MQRKALRSGSQPRASKRLPAATRGLPYSDLIELQRRAGNRAVVSLFQPVVARLTVQRGRQKGPKRVQVTETVARTVSGARTIGDWKHQQNRAHWAGFFNGLALTGHTVSFGGHTNTVRVSPRRGFWCYLDQEGGELEEFPANQLNGRTTGASAILTDYDVVEKTIRGVKSTIYRPTNTYLGQRDTSRTHTYTAN